MRKTLTVLVSCILCLQCIYAGNTDNPYQNEDVIKERKNRSGSAEPEESETDGREHTDSHLLHRMEGLELLEDLYMDLGATLTAQGTVNAEDHIDYRRDVTDGTYSIDLEFEKDFEKNASAFIHFETGNGAGVNDELRVFSDVNYDADDSDNTVSLTELWYKREFYSMSSKLTFGKLDPTVYIDENNFANDETTQFLAMMFRDSPAVEYPNNGPGIYLNSKFQKLSEVRILAIDGDSDWEDLGNALFAAAQLNFEKEFGGRRGVYRIYWWFSGRKHTGWSGSRKKDENSKGFGVNFDQYITESFGIFGRYANRKSEVKLPGAFYTPDYSWSVGVVLKGSFWHREGDRLGIAAGTIEPSEEYLRSEKPGGSSENHLEMYYKWRVSEHISFSPEIQVINNPSGGNFSEKEDTIFVGGVRSQINF